VSARELGLPAIEAATGLPKRVTIWEVGARDGLQNEDQIVPVEVKIEFLDRLADAGLTVLEATSFVHPDWVPQLADAEELLAGLARRDGVSYPVLVPNERGLDRAAGRRVRPRRDLRERHRDVRQPQPQPHARRAVRHVRPGGDAGSGRGSGCPRVRVDVLRRPVGGRGLPRAGGRGR